MRQAVIKKGACARAFARPPDRCALASRVLPRLLSSSFHELEHTNWERGAEAYDKGFGPLTRQTIPTLLKQAGFLEGISNPGGDDFQLLDVATGPGYVLSYALAQSTQQQKRAGTLTGLDFSRGMLNIAKSNLRRDSWLGPGGVSLVEGDAQKLPFPDSSFDAVVCNYGILHLGRPEAFLFEALRCLRPGGRLSFSVWAAPPATEGFEILLQAVAAAGNTAVVLPEGPPFFRFAARDEAQTSMTEAGFSEVKFAQVEQTWETVRGPGELYDVFIQGTARTRALLEGQTPGETEAIKAHVSRSFSSRYAGSHLRMPSVVTSGIKVA